MMSSYGISNYGPQVAPTIEHLAVACRRIRDQTLGKTLTASWVSWLVKDDAYFEYMPVILQIGEVNYEFCWSGEEDCALSQDTIDTNVDSMGYGSDEYPLFWKRNALPPLQAVIGHSVTGMSLVEAQVTVGPNYHDGKYFTNQYWIANGITLAFGNRTLYLYNHVFYGNGISTGEPSEDGYRPVILDDVKLV
jgi:hypothetical protein